ncbi:QVR superfamily protein crim [Lycorma delicatula]|uniref:QVR superfamily protein crim n=1 Tax=Lycorma delicatula TaxID=130591 RepID=UPI003F516AE1
MKLNGYKMKKTIFFLITLTIIFTTEVSCFGIGSTLYCYQCISTHPGCGTQFNWWLYWSQACPEVDDTCVKIIERKGAEEIITRDCLSSLRAVRTDIPADHYEGCRPAAHDVRLAHYVNNSIKELDIKRNHYDSVTWCFCYFDNRCNSATSLFAMNSGLVLTIISILLPLIFIS